MDYFNNSANFTSSFNDGSSSACYNNTDIEKKKKKKKGDKKGKGNGGGGGGAVRLSTDPQSVAARERRHRISDRFKILQSMVPGGTKMDTVSMLDEAIHYVKFLKTQIWLHQAMINFVDDDTTSSSPLFVPTSSYDPIEGGISYPLLANPSLNTPSSSSSTQLLPLPDSCFQGHQEEQILPYDVYMKNQ